MLQFSIVEQVILAVFLLSGIAFVNTAIFIVGQYNNILLSNK